MTYTESEIRIMTAAYEFMIAFFDEDEAWQLSYDVLYVESFSEWKLL